MLYELHITIQENSPYSPEQWIEFCEGKGAKPLDIRLHGGFMSNPRQVMFAATMEGTDAQRKIWVEDWKHAVNRAGFPYTRVKVEVPLDKSKDFDVSYYETHVKALVRAEDFTPALNAAFSEGWAVSSNALYSKDDGMHKMYFTKRIDGTMADLYIAGDFFRLEYAEATWPSYCHTVRMESEAVIVDTNKDLDNGWA